MVCQRKTFKRYLELSLKGDTPIEERYEIIRKQKEAVFNQLEEVKLIKLRTFRSTTKTNIPCKTFT